MPNIRVTHVEMCGGSLVVGRHAVPGLYPESLNNDPGAQIGRSLMLEKNPTNLRPPL